jgi:YggT family protein
MAPLLCNKKEEEEQQRRQQQQATMAKPLWLIPAQQACEENFRHLQALHQRAEAWLHHITSQIGTDPNVRRLLAPFEEFKLRVELDRGASQRLQKTSFMRSRNFAAIIPGDSVAEMVVTSSVFNFLNIYNTLLITRLVLTWFPSAPEVIVNPLSTICDPYLNVFRGIIPNAGTLDLSPILAFLVLNVFTNTASALPAEMNSQPREKKLTWRQMAQRKMMNQKRIMDAPSK